MGESAVMIRPGTLSEQALDLEANLRHAADQAGAFAASAANESQATESPQGVSAPSPFGLFPEIHETRGIAGAFSSWFELWGGIIGAAHSVEAWPEDRNEWPDWAHALATIGLVVRPDDLDAALFGCNEIPDRPPQALRHGDRVRIRGYPAGVTDPDHYEIRNGFAFMDRPEDTRHGEAPSWIIQFDDGSVLAVGGMSGGVVTVVLADGSEVPVAILITQNSRADLDADGDEDHSSDVVELVDVWNAIKGVSSV